MSDMTDPQPDRQVVQCNYAKSTKVATKGARAYLVYPNRGNGYDRLGILVRSRGARWVEKWERADRLTNFRVKTLPPEHPLYGNDRLFPAEHAEGLLAAMRRDAPPGVPRFPQVAPVPPVTNLAVSRTNGGADASCLRRHPRGAPHPADPLPRQRQTR